MSNNFISKNIAGELLNQANNNTPSISQLDIRYVNQSGDELRGDLDLNNHKITNVGDPAADKDCVTKAYVDSKLLIINNPFIPGVKRYYDYLFIKDSYNPNFWISSYYNDGLIIINEDEYERVNNLVELTGSGYTTNGTFTYESTLKRLHFTNVNRFNIISKTSYSTQYTFILIMSQANGAQGRLFTSATGNRLFGYWDYRFGSLYIDDTLNALNGKGVNDGQRYIFTLRNDNGQKTAFINNEQYYNSNRGGNNWGKIVIGDSLSLATEPGDGYVYEAICFNKALSNGQISSIYKKLVKYYP